MADLQYVLYNKLLKPVSCICMYHPVLHVFKATIFGPEARFSKAPARKLFGAAKPF